VLAVFSNELRLLARDRLALVWMVVAPIVFITLIVAARYEGGDPPVLIPVVNDDGGPVAATFLDLLGKRADVAVVTGAEATRLVRDQARAAAAIVLPPGFSERYLDGRSAQMALLTDPADGLGLQRAKMLLLLAQRELASLDDPIDETRIRMVEKNLTGDRLTRQSHEQNVPGFAIMFMLFAVVFGTAASLRREGDLGTTARLLIAPVGFTRVLIAKLGVRLALGGAQLLVLLLWGHFAFGISLGSSRVAVVVVALACAFGGVALAMLIASIARTSAQVLPLALGVILLASAIAGLWWPLASEPEWMQRVALLGFPTWAMQALTDLVLRDRGLAAILRPVAIIVLESAVLLALGLRLFRTHFAAR
jgi:ABC-type multidrug transport system permease subunit